MVTENGAQVIQYFKINQFRLQCAQIFRLPCVGVSVCVYESAMLASILHIIDFSSSELKIA